MNDYQGSLAVLTDGSGNILESNSLLPYGQQLSGGTLDPFLFTGLEREANAGTDRALYRQYDATEDRWLTPDLYHGSYDPMDPQTFNRYAYVGGRPNLLHRSHWLGRRKSNRHWWRCWELLRRCAFRRRGCPCGYRLRLVLVPGYSGPVRRTELSWQLAAAAQHERSRKLRGVIWGSQPASPSRVPVSPALSVCQPEMICDFGPCGGGPSSFQAAGGVVAGTIVCQFAEPCGAIEDSLLIIGAIGVAGYDIYQMSRGGKGEVGHDYVRDLARAAGGDYCSALKAIVDSARKVWQFEAVQ